MQFYASAAKMLRLLSLHVCMCMCLRVSLRSLDVRIGRRRRTLLSHIHYQLQKNIKEMRISLSPIDRR